MRGVRLGGRVRAGPERGAERGRLAGVVQLDVVAQVGRGELGVARVVVQARGREEGLARVGGSAEALEREGCGGGSVVSVEVTN